MAIGVGAVYAAFRRQPIQPAETILSRFRIKSSLVRRFLSPEPRLCSAASAVSGSFENDSVVRSTTPDTLQPPVVFTHGWICEIVAFGDSGLFVKAGLPKGGSSFGYFVAELDVEQTLKAILELPAVFM